MISAADLEKLRLGSQNRCHVKVRGVEFIFRPLTIGETADVTTTALAKYTKLMPEEKHTINESRIIAILTLLKASELKPGMISLTEDTLNNCLTPDELGYLMREYTQMCANCNPAIEQIPDDELHAIAEDVKKNSRQPTDLSSLQLLNLVRYLLINPPLLADK